jgi:hypothetical protein
MSLRARCRAQRDGGLRVSVQRNRFCRRSKMAWQPRALQSGFLISVKVLADAIGYSVLQKCPHFANIVNTVRLLTCLDSRQPGLAIANPCTGDRRWFGRIRCELH